MDFPTRPVTIIVPWNPGGATDLLFRAVATVFPKYANGQPLVINNIPGAGAVTGTMEFLKAPAVEELFKTTWPVTTWAEVLAQ